MARIASESEMALRYQWLLTYGVYTPVFNDPRIIHETATPEYVDGLVQREMKRWATPLPVLPLVA